MIRANDIKEKNVGRRSIRLKRGKLNREREKQIENRKRRVSLLPLGGPSSCLDRPFDPEEVLFGCFHSRNAIPGITGSLLLAKEYRYLDRLFVNCVTISLRDKIWLDSFSRDMETILNYHALPYLQGEKCSGKYTKSSEALTMIGQLVFTQH